MPRRKHAKRVGRHTTLEVARRVEQLREKRRLTARQLAAKAGILESQYSKKVRCEGSTFTFEEIGVVADVLEAPPGWPLLEEDVAEFLRAALKVIVHIH